MANETLPIENLDNTTHVSATFQALYACREFRNNVLSHLTNRYLIVHFSIGKLFDQMVNKQFRVIRPIYFCNLFPRRATDFSETTENDVHLFLQTLAGLLSSELFTPDPNRQPGPQPTTAQQDWDSFYQNVNHTYITDLMFVQIENHSKCENCKQSNYAWDKSLGLQLAIGASERQTLQTLLNAQYGNAVTDQQCERCSQSGALKRRRTVARKPAILVITLMRFAGKDPKNKAAVEVEPQIVVDQQRYSLFATVHHNGDRSNAGHYYAIVRHELSWYECRDSSGRAVAKKRNQFDAKKDSTDAYMAYYRREASATGGQTAEAKRKRSDEDLPSSSGGIKKAKT